MSTIKELLNNRDPETLHKIWMIGQEFQERKRKEQEEHERKHLENLKRYCFNSKVEMLEYLKAGNFIAEYHGYEEEGLQFVNGKVKQTYMDYTDIGMPCGYSSEYFTEEEFMNNPLLFNAYDNGYDPRWMKVG